MSQRVSEWSQFTRRYDYVKTVGGLRVHVFYTSSDDASYCTMLWDILKGFQVTERTLKFTKGHNSMICDI